MVPEDNTTYQFQGVAVMANGRIACVLRPGAQGAEVYCLSQDNPALQAVLSPTADGEIQTLSSLAIVENNPGVTTMEVKCKKRDGTISSLRYTVKMGQPCVETKSQRGVNSLRVEAPCRFLVMPDFFADDIVIDAADLPVSHAELPSDHVLLHLLPGGQAMVMTVAKTSEEDIRVVLDGAHEKRLIRSSELRYGKEGEIWVGILAAPAIWHMQEVAPAQAGKEAPLSWKAPFPAQWRVDWQREEKLTDSWDMVNERPDGSYTKPSTYGGPDTLPPDRKRWTTVLGTFNYPAWIDKSGQGHLQPLKTPALRFNGPALIYPINRVSGTKLDTFTVLDIVRNTLGVGPCEYILDVEGQRSAYQGRATCGVRDTLNPIYAAKQQKQRKAEIEKVLQELMVFVRHIRGRIENYAAFGHETLAYLAEQKQAHPELSERLSELESLARRIDARYAARKQAIKTPEEVAQMVEEFRQTVLDCEGDDALARCRRFTEGWVVVGGNQDELAGECRWAVKMIRQKAGLLMAQEPRVAEAAKEIRRRSQIVLRNPANHEGARH